MSSSILIETVKQARKRVKITIAGEEEPISLSQEIAFKWRLTAGMQIPRSEWWKLVREAEDADCYEKLLTLLDQRFHSQTEIWRKLYKRRFPKPAIDKAIARAIELGLLNDLDFTRVFVDEKIRGGKASRRRIVADLRSRGVDSQLIEQVLEEQADAFTPEASFEQALALAQQRHRTWEREPEPRKRKEKILRFLAGRGYPTTICYQVADALLARQPSTRKHDQPPFPG